MQPRHRTSRPIPPRQRPRQQARLAGLATLAALAGLLSACGGEQYQYVESTDGHLFAKVPADWEVGAQGAVSYQYLLDDNLNRAYTLDDTTIPWRAEFQADPDDPKSPFGLFESQLLDARYRPGFLLSELVDTERGTQPDYRRESIEIADVEGYHVSYQVEDGDDTIAVREVWLIDDRKEGIYRAAVWCEVDCVQRYGDEIDEILGTVRVVP